MQQFLRPPGLRVRALQLLHLLLDSPVLAEAFEQSLAQAGAAAQAGETPGRSAGTGGTDGGTGGESGGKVKLSIAFICLFAKPLLMCTLLLEFSALGRILRVCIVMCLQPCA